MTGHVTVPVGLGDRAYDILIGPGLVGRAGAEIARLLPGVRAAMARLMDERYPVYAHADVTVPTRDERKEVIAAEVIEALTARLGTQEGKAAE